MNLKIPLNYLKILPNKSPRLEEESLDLNKLKESPTSIVDSYKILPLNTSGIKN